jgi:hypothetical protein
MEKEPLITSPESADYQTEHLKEDVSPIMVCVGTAEDYQDQLNEISSHFDDYVHGVHNADYFSDSEILDRKGFKNTGNNTYVISPLDKFDKFSEGFYNCTGLIVVGRNKRDGENISFLSHQDPEKFLHSKREDFITHLDQILSNLKVQVEEGTIDAIIIGGRYLPLSDRSAGDSYDIKNYVGSVNLLSEEVRKILGFDPVVVNGPKFPSMKGGADKVYFDNKNRRAYLIRPRVNSDLKDFTQPELEKKRKTWW